MPSPAASSSSPTLSPKSSPKSLSRMAPIAEEPQVDAQSAAAQASSNAAASSGNEDGYDSASSTNSGSASSGGRRSRNPGLTIDTVTASASNTSATATAQSPTSPASSSGTTSPTSATSPTSGNGPMTPTTPLSDEVDFSLVYALHTFVATMEGQVAVVRNEPLILLDDSNSYWWLVKPLRSNTIGYIPAEIIETPYERLARVNQQKNVERALFRSNDIPGAPSKSTRPSLHPKTVVFPSDPRGDIFEYSPAVSDMSSGDEDEEDWDPENTKNPTEVAVVASQDEDTIMDDTTAQEQAVAQAQEDDAMDVDAPAAAAAVAEPAVDRDEGVDEDELKPNPRRTSLGAGLLLRNRDQWSGDEDELPSDAADVEPQRAPSPSPSPTKATASSSPPTSPVKSSSRPAISSPTRPIASIPLEESDANTANDADDDEDVSEPAPSAPAPTAAQPTRSASASEIDPITVLRIFPGTCAIPADSHQFKTVVVTKTMSVKELLHQALLKYRVFGPLAAQHQGSNLDAMMADWYLTLSFTGAPTAGHHHVMNPDENVLGALEAVQKQAEEEAAAVAAAQQQAEAAAAAAHRPSASRCLPGSRPSCTRPRCSHPQSPASTTLPSPFCTSFRHRIQGPFA
ncbi:hypothetical protein BCR44DRAFT_1098065 [Catenaria anguillulae PL171]|uniref:SH3 domain-containing protein n=1 Tax=Catenaria anguillulae PL171 TaxID=765915 RepID=A0A1Y2I1B3_9FUNG|nr:hypothetical protein BCR44DRAFT_1098065 [Catenaria anguillulae PL171]